MDQQEDFKRVKERVLQGYADYLDAIRNTSFEDLDDFHARKRLIEAFSRSVERNSDYRNFITKHTELQIVPPLRQPLKK